MKKLVGYIISWALFYIGDVTSKVMELTEEGWTWKLYPVYNKCMSWSLCVQQWAGTKTPWNI